MRTKAKLFALIFALVLALLCSCAGTKTTYEPPKKNVTVSLGFSSLTMVPEESRTFSPTFKNAQTDPKLIWSSSDESIVTVTQDGTVTAHNSTASSQTAKITATIADNPNMKSTCEITVISPMQAQFAYAGPGQDASTQAIISWHSTNATASIMYTDANSSEFVHLTELEGTKTESHWADLSGIYRYRMEFNDLVPGSTYKYKIWTTDDSSSETYSFRTAAKSASFSFAWLSDIHASRAESMGNIIEILGSFKEKTDISFCLFSGDFVNQGKRYKYWSSWTESGLLGDMEYAFLVGNHEYYPDFTADKATASYYLDFAAIPQNAEGSPKSDFWFLYDNVLFICLDSMASDFGGTGVLESQGKWLKDVVSLNEGKYTYLIVTQHYAFLDGDEEGSGFYSFWYPIFDQCHVDLALSSDSHAYSRSKTLFDDKPAEKGTVYITSPMIEGKAFSEIISDEGKLGKRSAFNTVKDVTGGAYITVTPETMTVHVIGKDGIEYDSVTVKANNH